MKMELIKLSNDRLGFKGSIEYYITEFKHIEYDGERYTREVKTLVNKTVEELRVESEHYFNDIEYSFNEIDYKLSIEEYSGFTRPLSNGLRGLFYSENQYVNCICKAFELGFLDKRITNVYSGKTQRRYDWNDIISNMEVSIPFIEYGFNNSVYYTISIETLLNIPIKKIPENLLELFKKNGIDLNSNNINNILIKLINKKVDYETSKQQKSNRISI